MNLYRDRARGIRSVAGDLSIALHRMHVSEIYAAALHLAGHNQLRPGTDFVNIHMPVGAVLQLILGDRLRVRRPHQEGAEVPGIMGIWKGNRWTRAELAHEGPR